MKSRNEDYEVIGIRMATQAFLKHGHGHCIAIPTLALEVRVCDLNLKTSAGLVQKRTGASMALGHPSMPCMLAAPTLGLTQKSARIEGTPKGATKEEAPRQQKPWEKGMAEVQTETRHRTHFGSPGKAAHLTQLSGSQKG